VSINGKTKADAPNLALKVEEFPPEITLRVQKIRRRTDTCVENEKNAKNSVIVQKKRQMQPVR